MTSKFKGTYTVTVTAFDDEGGFDPAAMRRYVDWQIEEGIHGLIPLGSTGEFLSLSDEERHDVAAVVIEATRGRVPVFVGTAAESTDDVIRYSRDAEQLGADGLMIIPPFYCTPTEDELFEHYRRIAEAVSLPIMLYNNPAASNVDMKPETVARLAQIDNVCLIKESTLEVTRVRDILRCCGDRMSVFGGVLGFESFLAGAVGWVAVGSNVAPRAFADLYRRTVEDEDLAEARRIYRRILPIIDSVFGRPFVSNTKAMLNHIGMRVGAPRPPRLPARGGELAHALEALAACDIGRIEATIS